MAILKKIDNQELYLYMNGNLIYKRWLDTGVSKVFDIMAYDKYTLTSIRELEYENPNELILVKAFLKMRSTAEGGRKTGFTSGYKPNHVFEYGSDGELKETFIGDIILDGENIIEPGEQKEVTVRFLLNQPIEKYLNKGQVWWIHEGPNLIAEAKVI